jgi:menaquinone-dependent protoporphyrinogen oxidase
MNILVTHGSKRGGTAGIAARIGEALREAGITVEVLPAREVRDVRRYDAVLVGGALYAGFWQADAQRLVMRHAAALRERPVWFFSSGPLDDSASRDEIPPTAHVQQLMDSVGASGHATFGGRLSPDARGFIASSMAKKVAGDFRDEARIAAWARLVAHRIEAELAEPRAAHREWKPLPSRALPLGLCLVAGISALLGGAGLVMRPDGSGMGMPLEMLQHSPFHDFLVPGLLLLVVIGGANIWAAYLHAVRSALAVMASFVSGSALVVWIVVEMIMLRSVHPLHVAYLVLGVAIVAEATSQFRMMMPPAKGSHPARSPG